MGILKELGLVGNIPVNIEKLIRGQGIKLNTNARPEDFNLNKKPKTEYYKDSRGRKITVHYFKASAQYEIEGKSVKHVVTLNRLDIKKNSNGWKLISGV